MSRAIHFLGWDAPVVDKVCDFLVRAAEPDKGDPAAGTPLDLDGLLIVVPTRQAGRRLREALALTCSRQDTALLSARTLTPAFFLRNTEGGPDTEASPMAAKAVWADILLTMDPDDYGGLFPVKTIERDYTWAVQAADMLEGLRRVLADAGHRIGDVPAVAGSDLKEPERWRAMAALEGVYLERLRALGWQDPVQGEIARAVDPVLPDGVDRIIVAGVPAPTPLMVRALEALEKRVPVTVLVHAPETIRDRFDDWGRPAPTSWSHAEIEIEDFDRRVRLAASPEDQARLTIEAIADCAGDAGPADIGIGVPDRTVIPFLESALAARGLPAFDPAEKRVSDHALYRLLTSLADLLVNPAYDAFSALLRHPDVLLYLDKTQGVTTETVLSQLDLFQNRHLPMDFPDVERHLAGTSPGEDDDRSALATAARFVRDRIDAFAREDPETAIREFLKTVFSVQETSGSRPEGRELEAVAEAVDQALRECSVIAETIGLDAPRAMTLLLDALGDQTYPRERENALLDLEGWLELPWTAAPVLILTGMNEGSVPDTRLSDVFVPDALRRALDLPDDAARLARDAYLLTTLLESRRARGRVVLIAGKRSTAGDPLKPSRLLFRCRDDQLLARARRLLGDVEDPQRNYPFHMSFRLDPASAGRPETERPDVTHMSATRFHDYLVCPFRFYLKHVLRMEPLDDEKSGLDALDFGSLMHKALETLATDETIRGCADEHVIAGVLRKALSREAEERFGAEPSLAVTMLLESARQRLGAAARIHAGLAKDGWEIMLPPEQRLTMELNGMTIVGSIDRVDRHRDTGAVRIIDYKTSDSGADPRRDHLGSAKHAQELARVRVRTNGKEKEYAWTRLQLPVYRLLLEAGEDVAGPIELAYFNMPLAVGETGVAVWEDFDDERLEQARDCAARIIDAVRQRIFWPPAERVTYDDFEDLFFDSAEASVDGQRFATLPGGTGQ
jgi:ATP-dependent helicase/nuclease subunit B